MRANDWSTTLDRWIVQQQHQPFCPHHNHNFLMPFDESPMIVQKMILFAFLTIEPNQSLHVSPRCYHLPFGAVFTPPRCRRQCDKQTPAIIIRIINSRIYKFETNLLRQPTQMYKLISIFVAWHFAFSPKKIKWLLFAAIHKNNNKNTHTVNKKKCTINKDDLNEWNSFQTQVNETYISIYAWSVI